MTGDAIVRIIALVSRASSAAARRNRPRGAAFSETSRFSEDRRKIEKFKCSFFLLCLKKQLASFSLELKCIFFLCILKYIEFCLAFVILPELNSLVELVFWFYIWKICKLSFYNISLRVWSFFSILVRNTGIF